MSRTFVQVVALVALVAGAAAPAGYPADQGVRGVQTFQAYFAITYVDSNCSTHRCATPAKGAAVSAFSPSGKRLFRLLTSGAGKTRVVAFPPGRSLIVVQPTAFRGRHWTALRFHATAPWAGTTPVRFALRFCLATKLDC